ncbi:TetR/AcrR family transcriptional regulator [Actinoallomurus acaciae]|uniref:TetR/AcrR family transcriptional regulator n=1 Tax=Actinoallomurus acaciae TaxID=502577 RepID=A0ABV5YLU1_9ACTN
MRKDRLPRRRLDVETRRADILRAAAGAFAVEPYDKVSVARVAAVAGASEALVHRYFGSKSGLYRDVVRAAIDELLRRQRAADTPAAAPYDRLAVSVRVYLDAVADAQVGWAAPLRSPAGDVPEAAELRRRTRGLYLALLRDLLALPADPALDHALHGYLGFLDAACLSWVERGCPPAEREPLVAQVVGAIRGALGQS